MQNEKDGKQVKAARLKEHTQKSFGENLFALMNMKGITQKDLAHAVGITPASLSAYKNGSKSPTLPVAAAIAKELGVSLDWLCDIDKPTEPKRENITYSDIIRQLIDLSNLAGASVEDATISKKYGDAVAKCIFLKNDVLNHFLKEWKQVKDLLDNGTIGKNIYDPWVVQQLKDYDCPLDEVPSKLEGSDDILPF